MITFALPERDVARLRRFVRHLEAESFPSSVDLSEANVLVGWLVQKDRSDGAARYSVWTPDDRPESVPWALPPCRRRGDRDWCVELLRDLWLPDALELLAEEEAEGTEEIRRTEEERARGDEDDPEG